MNSLDKEMNLVVFTLLFQQYRTQSLGFLRGLTLLLLIGIESPLFAQGTVSDLKGSSKIEIQQQKIFNSIVGAPARSLRKFSWAWQRSAMQNINGSFLGNNLMFGLTRNFEVGFAPTYYLASDKIQNFSFKYNFWQGENWDWAWSFSQFNLKFETDGRDFLGNPKKISGDWVLLSNQISVNHSFPDSRYSVGVFYSLLSGYFNSNDVFYNLGSYKNQTEYGLDLQIETGTLQWLTLGVAQLRQNG